MKEWLVYTLIAFLAWGFWGFFSKLATRYLDPRSVIIYESIGVAAVLIVVFFLIRFNVGYSKMGILFSILTGIAVTIGMLAFFYALSHGKASVVVPMTALYPIITIALGFLVLKESVSVTQGLGILFAIVSMILFSL